MEKRKSKRGVVHDQPCSCFECATCYKNYLCQYETNILYSFENIKKLSYGFYGGCMNLLPIPLSTARAYFSEPGSVRREAILHRPDPGPARLVRLNSGPAQARSRPEVYQSQGAPEYVKAHPLRSKNLFRYTAIISWANHGFKFRSPASLIG